MPTQPASTIDREPIPPKKSLGQEITVALISAVAVGIFANLGVWLQFRHADQGDFANQQYHAYLDAQKAFADYWTTVTAYSNARSELQLEMLCHELSQPHSTITTNLIFTGVEHFFETNCVTTVASVNITNRQGVVLVTHVRTNVDCVVSSVIQSNFAMVVSNNIVFWKLDFRPLPQALAQKEEALVRTYHVFLNTFVSAKPFFSARVGALINQATNPNLEFHHFVAVKDFKDQLQTVYVSTNPAAAQSVLDKITDTQSTNLRTNALNKIALAALSSMQTELAIASRRPR